MQDLLGRSLLAMLLQFPADWWAVLRYHSKLQQHSELQAMRLWKFSSLLPFVQLSVLSQQWNMLAWRFFDVPKWIDWADVLSVLGLVLHFFLPNRYIQRWNCLPAKHLDFIKCATLLQRLQLTFLSNEARHSFVDRSSKPNI